LIEYQKEIHNKLMKDNKIKHSSNEGNEMKKKFSKKKKFKGEEIIKNSDYHKKPRCSCYRYNF